MNGGEWKMGGKNGLVTTTNGDRKEQQCRKAERQKRAINIRLNHNFCYTMTKNFKFIFLYLCLTSVNKICTIVINNVLPANREIIDALLVEVWRFLVEESLEAAFEVIVVFELPSVEEVAQRPE